MIPTRPLKWLFASLLASFAGTIYAAVDFSQIGRYRLPIAKFFAVAVALSPIVNILFQAGGHWYIKVYKPNMSFLFKVVLGTMAYESFSIPKSSFEDIWKEMFSEKSLQIKVIEQSFECCGFASVKDRIYPFPGKYSNASACVDLYGYTEPCLPQLQNATRQIAISLLVVIVLNLILNAGLRKSGFGFLFQGYTDDPDARGAWESEAGERAPLLDNRQADNLESLSDEGRQGPSAGSIVDPSID